FTLLVSQPFVAATRIKTRNCFLSIADHFLGGYSYKPQFGYYNRIQNEMESTVLYTVRALYDYTSPHDDDLNFSASQLIRVTAEEDDDWSYGEYTDKNGKLLSGIFPRNYVEKVESPPAVTLPPRPVRTKQQISTDRKSTRLNS